MTNERRTTCENYSAEIKRPQAMEQAMGGHSRDFIDSRNLKPDLQSASLGRSKSPGEIISQNSDCRITVSHVATEQPVALGMAGKADPQRTADFQAVLLAIAGHDLRQPLQIIQSSHELLGIGVRTKSEQSLLQTGQHAIDRLNGQLDQLLGALRLCEHSKEARLSPVALEPLFRQACHENEESALQKGIDIRVCPTGASVMSNALLLNSILRNLVSNAIKYTEPKGQILIGCRRMGQNVRIDVCDTGIGITGEQLSRIFEAFTRLDSARCDGLGVGLFIVRRAIDVLGHRLDVSSAASRGSRFSVFATRTD